MSGVVFHPEGMTRNIRCDGVESRVAAGDDGSRGKGMSRTSGKMCRSTERPPEPIVGQKKLYRWYSNWKILQFTCQHCGWTGKGEKTFPNEGGVLECPRCDRGVAYVQFPSLRDTEQAAEAGNEGAIRDLREKRERIRRLEARMNKFWCNRSSSTGNPGFRRRGAVGSRYRIASKITADVLPGKAGWHAACCESSTTSVNHFRV
jgi:hypothetical protein